ncbi:hypothetical protein P691DRAFT_613031, partial [Macrolepiota fuliginosa MF-IS2]
IDKPGVSQQFINVLHSATLEESGLDEDQIYRLRNPPQEITNLGMVPGLAYGLQLFFDLANCPREAFINVRKSYMKAHPDKPIPPHHKIKKLVEELTEIAPLYFDMCPNSCVGYTGPFSAHDSCPTCSTSRYKPGTDETRERFIIIPLNTQLQALWRDKDSAE